jgi:aldose 1-epimerase
MLSSGTFAFFLEQRLERSERLFLDFRQFRPFRPGIGSEFNHIRDFKGYDHPFVIDGWQPNILGEVGELREKSSGRCVKVLSSQPSV